jgi:hypothetical protein
MRRALLPLAALLALSSAAAQPAPPAAPSSSAPAAAPQASASASASGTAGASAKAAGTCVERLPEGRARPKLHEEIESRGISGHAQLLKLAIEHGPGETVLPSGFRLEPSSDEYKALEASHFFLPDPNGDAKPQLEKRSDGTRTVTLVKLWFVPLPEKPGRNQLTLPPVPIAISRASGELVTLCTSPHVINIEDPIANDPNPSPHPNPKPRIQREEWTLAKQVTYVALIAMAVGALLATLIGVWRRRPKQLPPPPPPRPPWEVAIEGLYDLRHSGLLGEQRFAEFYDRVSDILRRYLGDRYGYDGLESTTREALGSLRRIAMPLEVLLKIQEFMQDADLVKFARRTPTEAECSSAMERAELLISQTRPVIAPPIQEAPNGPGGAP